MIVREKKSSKLNMKSKTQFKIIRPASLQFLLCYGGETNAAVVARIQPWGKGHRQFTGCANHILEHIPDELEEKRALIVAPLLSEWFKKDPTTEQIYAHAKKLGLREMHPSAALCLAECYTKQPKKERILIGHKPVTVPSRDCFLVLSVENAFNDGRIVNGAEADPKRKWPLGSRFAFEDSAMVA